MSKGITCLCSQHRTPSEYWGENVGFGAAPVPYPSPLGGVECGKSHHMPVCTHKLCVCHVWLSGSLCSPAILFTFTA